MATPSIELSQADVGVVTEAGGDLQVSQLDVIALYNFPTEFLQSSQMDTLVVVNGLREMQISQMDVIAVVRGRVDDPQVRAWTFTLDGHDFYVLRLGNAETLVYDMTTEQWSVYSTGTESYWSVYTGVNWIGGNTFAAAFGSNIIVGSDANGSLYFLDPNKPNDDAALEGRSPVPFRRRVTGQIATRGYDVSRVFEVQLIGSMGDLDAGALTSIELLYSDNRGDSYVSAGTITSIENDYDVRASWRSLGSFRAPGRLFRIEDDGALKRIDSLTVNATLNDGS